jgi:hypothetical protein
LKIGESLKTEPLEHSDAADAEIAATVLTHAHTR